MSLPVGGSHNAGGLSRRPHPEGQQPSVRVKDLEQENTHMVIRLRVTTKDMNTKKREDQPEEEARLGDSQGV